MKYPLALGTMGAVALLSACQSNAEQQADAVEDRIETQADASAAEAGAAPALLGLTERQLLDADLVAADGSDLGDIEQIRRGTNGAVDGLLVEIEDSNPDRYVVVPVIGLKTRVDGDDTDVETNMTAADLAAPPDAAM